MQAIADSSSFRFLRMKTTLVATLCSLLVLLSLVHAGPFDPRDTFGQAPGRDLDGALKRSKIEKKRVLLFYWNTRERDDYPGSDMAHFCSHEETKKLIKDHFILVLLDRDHKDVKPYLSPGQDLDRPQWALIDSTGKMLKTARVIRRGDTGFETVKELIAMP